MLQTLLMLSWLKVIKSLQLNHVPSSGGILFQNHEIVTAAKGTPPAYLILLISVPMVDKQGAFIYRINVAVIHFI